FRQTRNATCQTSQPDQVFTELKELRDIVVEQRVEMRDMVVEQRVELREMVVEQRVELRNMVVEQRVELKEMVVEQRVELRNMVVEQRVELRNMVVEQRVELRNMVVEQRVELRNMGARVTASESQVDELEVEELKKENADRPKVAFYAALTDSGRIGPFNAEVPLVYSKVFPNKSESDAPNPGDIGVYMYKNYKRIMFNYAHNPGGNRRFVVNAVTLELEEGVLYMSLPSGRGLCDDSDNLNANSGFLLFPM
uniref:C1q domain-containing protein n=1 Tax=Hucho hucho TaxID=62062 RepID=A0A4W5JT66_9TELE